MITLPDLPAPNAVEPWLLDFGGVLRPPTGAAALKVVRKGTRFALKINFPPMRPEVSRIFVSRLLRAKDEGLRIAYPLLGVDQGGPGAPVVDGAAGGSTLPLRGLTPFYSWGEGFWLSVVGTDGQHFLHNVAAPGQAGEDGRASLPVYPLLRRPFTDGCQVRLAEPMVEGLVTGEAWSWQIPVNGLIALSVPLEEAE